MTNQITTADRLAVMKQYVASHDDDYIQAANRHLTADQIRDIRTAHGYPNRDSMERALDVLQRKADQEAAGEIPEAGHVERLKIRPVPSPERVVAPPKPDPDATLHLLERAAKSPKKRTRNLAEKTAAQINQLRDLLTSEDADIKARKADEERKAKARAEVERLERELKAAKARLTGRPAAKAKTTTSKPTIEAGVIRAWARDNNVACPTKGVIPRHVRQAYETANTPAAS